MAIAFVLIPAGFIDGGFLLGLLGTKLAHATEWLHFWKAAGISIGLGQLALFSSAGLSLLSIPRPPLLQGKNLEAISKIVDESKAMNNGRLTMEERRVLISSPCMASFDVQNDGLHGRPVGSGQEPALTYSG